MSTAENKLAAAIFSTCECADSNCPVHAGSNRCLNKAESILYRIDMKDETGTAMCQGCGNDAMESGIFTDSIEDDDIEA